MLGQRQFAYWKSPTHVPGMLAFNTGPEVRILKIGSSTNRYKECNAIHRLGVFLTVPRLS